MRPGCRFHIITRHLKVIRSDDGNFFLLQASVQKILDLDLGSKYNSSRKHVSDRGGERVDPLHTTAYREQRSYISTYRDDVGLALVPLGDGVVAVGFPQLGPGRVDEDGRNRRQFGSDDVGSKVDQPVRSHRRMGFQAT